MRLPVAGHGARRRLCAPGRVATGPPLYVESHSESLPAPPVEALLTIPCQISIINRGNRLGGARRRNGYARSMRLRTTTAAASQTDQFDDMTPGPTEDIIPGPPEDITPGPPEDIDFDS